jgi:hypothetical protein
VRSDSTPGYLNFRLHNGLVMVVKYDRGEIDADGNPKFAGFNKS